MGETKLNQSLGIIILNFNSYEDSEKCVSLFLLQIKSQDRILLIDNNSSDGSGQRLADKFEKSYDLNPDIVKEHLYKEENPNTYLAQIGRFLIENKDNDYAQKVIKTGLRAFVENQILQFEESANVPIYFVGSIAHFLSKEVEEVLSEYNLKLGKIVRHPITTLANFHSENI